jgi:hypothetical protein
MLIIVRAWILLSALLVGSGWILSALHQLNRIGYGVVFALAATAVIYWWRQTIHPTGNGLSRVLPKFRRRFKRPAPLLFLLLALLAFLAGALYVHTNADSNGYRVPRVLHWLGSEQWHWIHTDDKRVNVVACNFEWLSAPLILFTRTDRLLFLINFLSYLMLPGLIFSIFRRLEVRPRVAWWWMWILSSGWGFVIQASSDLNDFTAAIYALAAVDFALRARESRRISDVWLSMLAAALMTGIKQTNIPLALLWLVAAWPSLWLMLARPVATIFIGATSLLVSAVPITFFNVVHYGNWKGLAPGEKPFWSAGSHFWKVVGNLFSIPIQNLVPPLFPWAGRWDKIRLHFLQTPFGAHFAMMERFGHLGMGISEWNAGVGLGISVLAMISLIGASGFKRLAPADNTKPLNAFPWLVIVTPWVLLLVFMAEICSDENARLISAYYVFLFPLLLVHTAQERLVRRLWWQRLGILVMLMGAMVAVISRDRPLFPAKTIIGQLHTMYPRSKFLSTAWSHYAWRMTIVSVKRDLKNTLTKLLPSNERVVGYATQNGSFFEPELWFSSAHRRVKRVLPNDSPEELTLLGIHYVLVEDDALKISNMTITEWTQKYDGTVIDQWIFPKDPYRPPGHLYLVHLNN